MSVPTLGVVIVTYNAADVIRDCLESLLSATDVRLVIAVVDNASPDDTLAVIRDWASGAAPYTVPADMPFALDTAAKPVTLHDSTDPLTTGHHITLIAHGQNAGFAGGVNLGLAYLADQSAVSRFWVLNPDSAVPSGTPAAFANHPGEFALMGGRVIYYDTPDMIQIDGGTLNRRTGVTGNINLGASHAATPPANAVDFDFITGASMVASRTFYDHAGPMTEDYFLYYEEVDWALRRGTLPLAYCLQAVVYHKAGTAIGSPTLGRPASTFSLRYKHRARLMFIRRFYPASVVAAWGYSLAKALQLTLKGYPSAGWAILTGSAGRRG